MKCLNIWYYIKRILAMLIGALPFAAADIPLIFIPILWFFPDLETALWIYGLIVVIQGPQDGPAVLYYVVFGLIILKNIITLIFFILKKRR
jgi:fumarate reductase subunit C